MIAAMSALHHRHGGMLKRNLLSSHKSHMRPSRAACIVATRSSCSF